MRATSVNNRSDRPAPSGCKVSRGDGKPMNKPKLNYWAYIPPMPAEEIARAVRDYESAGLEGIWISQTFGAPRSEEHTSELQSLMRSSYAVFCLNKKKNNCISHTNLYSDQYEH